jgi:hypothetical protein
MTWWQTLIVATVPALVALGGLLIQLKITNAAEQRRRELEDEQREKDRERADAALAETRRNSLEDYWREARHRTHVETLSILKSACERLYETLTQMQESGGEVEQSMEPTLGAEAMRLVTEVQLMGSDEASQAAGNALKVLVSLNLCVLVAASERRMGTEMRASKADELAVERYGAALDAIETYRKAVRRDLGTSFS